MVNARKVALRVERINKAVNNRPSIYIVFIFVLDGLIVCHLPYGPTAYFTLSSTVMRHDIPDVGTMSEAYPHLIFNQFSSKLGKRVSVRLMTNDEYVS